MKLDIDYINQLIDLLGEKDFLTELTLKDGEQTVTLKKEGLANKGTSVIQTQGTPTIPQEESKEEHKGKPVKSPMVGNFYRSANPNATPFVEVGETISQGQVVCIIEAMKLMNEIESDVEGKITEICVKDGDPVELGQGLMYAP